MADLQRQQLLQSKRRRVTRACDECRKKKVKCDGQQPCIHCTVYSYECTYNQPTKRNGSSLPTSTQQSQSVKWAKPTGSFNPNISATINVSAPSSVSVGSIKKQNSRESKLQAQVNKYKALFHEILPDLPDIDSLDLPTFIQIFRNFSSNSQYASSILQDTITEYHLIASDATPCSSKTTTPDGSSTGSNSLISTDVVESVDGSIQSHMGREIKIILPPKPIALQFLTNVWEHCCVLLSFYHRPSFIKQFDELYETDPQNYSHDQMQFLPLCYSTMAVGALFSKSMDEPKNPIGQNSDTELENGDENQNEEGSYSRGKFLEDEGYKYFIAARKLIDITNARDLNSIQTILMLIVFLQCSARLSTCYAYIGVAMRSALREGLHRSLTLESGFNPIEIEMRKRLFYSVHKLDIYVNAMLGLPRSLSPEDFDQTLPIELLDENITEEGYFPENENNVLSSAGIANQHTKLVMILDVIVRKLYPTKKTNNLISHDVVTDLEMKLREWLDGLPPELIPGREDVPKEYETANRLLHLSFFHVQLILYRPFIHYLSRKSVANNRDSLSIQRARNSISVARSAVNLAQEMLKKNLLTGSYWYGCYTIFYSVAGLLFYVHEAQPSDKESALEYEQILKDAEIGRNVLLQLKNTSMAADRTYNLLNKIFEKLNSKTIKLSEIHGNSEQQSATKDEKRDMSLQPTTIAPRQISDTSNSGRYFGPELSATFQSQGLRPMANEHAASPNKFNKTISGVNTVNTAATSNIPTNESDIFTKTDTTPMDGFSILDTINNDLFGSANMSDNSFKGLGEMTAPEGSENLGSDGVKREGVDSESYIPGAFDQLDIQLFGRYLPPYMSQQGDASEPGK
ncbi:hypothetical protein HG536_0B02890 [Torulaspora globosa]|uniref:Zn(2)-C6 fungal-type domain-containing protein n=1 Tax=Torulaspora globosa TaxID=48254 RepID=A0A7G3ZD40_9SACH|nr:uncharacterized protein HG536_0B02890 [Torulaspora globosa]QLL31426.1 hypothetical protein HG536_0B02890 [Torulaspora globosa]